MEKPGRTLGSAIELAMSMAVEWCAERNITNPDMVRRAKLEARARVKRDWPEISWLYEGDRDG